MNFVKKDSVKLLRGEKKDKMYKTKLIKTLKKLTPQEEKEEVIDTTVVTPEKMLTASKRAILRELQKPNPKATFVDLAIKICDREIPSWANSYKKDANIDDYKDVLNTFLLPSCEGFSILERRQEESGDTSE